ncbi:MAG: hypothetical protein WBF53_08115 [Litorimonas sp.]
MKVITHKSWRSFLTRHFGQQGAYDDIYSFLITRKICLSVGGNQLEFPDRRSRPSSLSREAGQREAGYLDADMVELFHYMLAGALVAIRRMRKLEVERIDKNSLPEIFKGPTNLPLNVDERLFFETVSELSDELWSREEDIRRLFYVGRPHDSALTQVPYVFGYLKLEKRLTGLRAGLTTTIMNASVSTGGKLSFVRRAFLEPHTALEQNDQLWIRYNIQPLESHEWQPGAFFLRRHSRSEIPYRASILARYDGDVYRLHDVASRKGQTDKPPVFGAVSAVELNSRTCNQYFSKLTAESFATFAKAHHELVWEMAKRVHRLG